MEITFLGTGTSQGIPLIACKCQVCCSPDPKDKRLRSSVMVTEKDKVIVIDSGPDFRQQMLREEVMRLDALLFTHAHKDHIAGMDDIRAFNYSSKRNIEVYADEIVQKAIHREFPYIFDEFKYPGVPEVNLHTITHLPFVAADLNIIPIDVIHYKLPVKGFRIGDFSYITDANYISEEEKLKLKNSKVLVLNALRKETHISHFSLPEAIELAEEIGAEQSFFTHISHQLGTYEEVQATLPPNIYLAYDGLKIRI